MPVTRSALQASGASAALSLTLRAVALDALAGELGLDDAFLDQPPRQLRHALDLVGDGAELLVEDDLVELLRLLVERHLEVLLPEELGIGQARGEHLAVARDDRRAAVRRASILAVQTKFGASLPVASAQAKYFWLVRMVSWITSRGTSRKAGSKRPSSGTGHSVRPAFSATSPSSATSVRPAAAAAARGAVAR